jgi:hypothetical protein
VCLTIFAAGLEFGVEAFCLQVLEDFGICTLRLTITSGVGDGGEADLGADRGAVLPERATGELTAIVCNDAVGNAETAYQPLDELDSRYG